MKRHLAKQRVYGGGKRPFGFDVVDGKLVPNKTEQGVIVRMRQLRKRGKTLREIAQVSGNVKSIACARKEQGRISLQQGQVEAGLAHLDLPLFLEKLSPLVTGLMYCSVIATCQQVYAFDRTRRVDTHGRSFAQHVLMAVASLDKADQCRRTPSQ